MIGFEVVENTSNPKNGNTNARIVRIKDTLHLEEIYISEALLEEARANTAIELLSEAFEFSFDENGNLIGTQ